MTDDRQVNFPEAIIQALLARSFGGAAEESTISEHWNDIRESRFGVRIREFGGAILGNLSLFFGLYLIGRTLTSSGTLTSWGDGALVGCGVAMASLLWWSAVELSFKGLTSRRRWAITALGVTLIMATLAGAALKLGYRSNPNDLVWIFIGASVAGPAAAFAYNQLSDLMDPMGLQSAFERQIQPLLDHWMKRQLRERKIVERPLIPYRHGNRETWLAQHKTGGEPDEEDGAVYEIPAQDDLTFCDFLEEAVRRGSGRRAWLKKGDPRYLCPSTKVKVTRTTYDNMIQKAADMGYLVRGGDGDASAWLVQPAEAYDDWCTRLEDEWGEVLGGDNGNQRS